MILEKKSKLIDPNFKLVGKQKVTTTTLRIGDKIFNLNLSMTSMTQTKFVFIGICAKIFHNS